MFQQNQKVRNPEANGYRLTAKRQHAINEAQKLGYEFNHNIFKNPLTRLMTTDELIEFSNSSLRVEYNVESEAIVNNLVEQQKNNFKVKQELTDEEVLNSITERFSLLEELTLSTALGISPSLIVSGSAGIGKTTEIMNAINSLDMGDACKTVKGKVTPLALYKLLYEVRHSGSLLVLDDSDDCWDDETSMNLIKAATDSSDERIISWHSSRRIYDDDDIELPSDFIFEGSIIFISNLDFYSIAESNNKLAPHFNAMISRSFVLDLAMRNSREYLLRIKSILFNDSFGDDDMTMDIKHDIYNFMTKERDNLRDISLRMVKKLHIIIKTYGSKWENNARILFCKRT